MSLKYDKEKMARVFGRALPISTKNAIEICRVVRNMEIKKAKKILEDVITMKKPVPFKRFTGDLGHKKKLGPAKYPVKTATDILKLIQGVEANAQFKGLNTNDLVISHIKADKASKTWHYGRQRRRQMKRTNLELVVEEKISKKKENKLEKKEKTATKEVAK